jgi:protein-S-isoprenylcysteine O-methyltransferase Ste14
MKAKLSRWGIGPIFALLSIAYAVLLELIVRVLKPRLQMDFIPHSVLIIIAVCLFLIGIPFFTMALISVHRAYAAHRLITNGVFSLCRNPVYASWIVLFVPGITLIRANWLGMTIPLFMYVILRLLVKKEEVYLESVFNKEYVEYKKRVMCILPFSWIKHKGKNIFTKGST